MSKPKKLPSQQYLKECFDYSPDTGELLWKKRPPHHFKDKGSERGWNTKYAGALVSSSANGYLQVSVDGIRYRAHRIIWKIIYGTEPRGIDHKDTNRANNSLDNLREATQRQNSFNVAKKRANKSGHKGVSWHKVARKWTAAIRVAGQKRYLGLYENIDDAAKAYQEAAAEHHGEFIRFD